MRSVPAFLCPLTALGLHGVLLFVASTGPQPVAVVPRDESFVSLEAEELVQLSARAADPTTNPSTAGDVVRSDVVRSDVVRSDVVRSDVVRSDSAKLADAELTSAELAADELGSGAALGVAESGLPARLARLTGSALTRPRLAPAPQEKRPARLTTGARACRDLLDPRYFESEPAALVKVAVNSAGDAAFAGLEHPHPAGAAFEHVSRACVSRMHFIPARDERGQAMASTAVLRLSRPL